MARILRKKRKSGSVAVSESLPFFEVLYMGRIETEPKQDRDCTRVIVQHLVDKTRNEPLKPVRITITNRGLWVQEGPKFNPPRRETFVPIHNISYGSADKKYTKVFTFVTNFRDPIEPRVRDGSESVNPFYCYAFRCDTQAIARAMVVYLLRAFKDAYIEWQRECNKKDVKKQLYTRIKLRSDERRRSFDLWRPIGRRQPGDGRRQSDSTSESLGSNNDRQPLDSGGSTDEEFEPNNTANSRTEKLSHYLERWVRQQRTPHRMSNTAGDTSGSDNDDLAFEERDASFRRRADRFSRPDILNCDVDWYQEMKDPDVQDVLQGVMKMNIPP